MHLLGSRWPKIGAEQSPPASHLWVCDKSCEEDWVETSFGVAMEL